MMRGGSRPCFMEQPCTTSGQMFDWWRCSIDGVIVKPPPCVPPLPRKQPPRFVSGDVCWPLYLNIPANSVPGVPQEKDELACDISRDFWPDKGDRSGARPRYDHHRVPWVPSKLDNKFGVSRQAPPYTMYSRDRQTLQQSICRP